MRTAKSMYDYYFYNGLKQRGCSKPIRHFRAVERELLEDEEVLLCFMGKHDYPSKDGWFAYAFTNRRIIMAKSPLLAKPIVEEIGFVHNIRFEENRFSKWDTVVINGSKKTYYIGIRAKISDALNLKLLELRLPYVVSGNIDLDNLEKMVSSILSEARREAELIKEDAQKLKDEAIIERDVAFKEREKMMQERDEALRLLEEVKKERDEALKGVSSLIQNVQNIQTIENAQNNLENELDKVTEFNEINEPEAQKVQVQ